MRGHGHRRIPLKSVRGLAIFGLRANRALLSCAHVAPRDISILRFGVHNPGFHRVDSCIETIAAVNYGPIFVRDAVSRRGLARSTPASVILQTAADHVRLLVVDRDLIELPD